MPIALIDIDDEALDRVMVLSGERSRTRSGCTKPRRLARPDFPSRPIYPAIAGISRRHRKIAHANGGPK